MIPWIIVIVLALLLVIQRYQMIRAKMYMADYVLLMFSDERYFENYRKDFLDAAKTWNEKLRNEFLWLHANRLMSRYIPDWGKKFGSPKLASAALKEWLVQEGVVRP